MKNQMVKRICAFIVMLAMLVSFVSCSTPLNLDELFGYGENNGGDNGNNNNKPDDACKHEKSSEFTVALHESAYCYEYVCVKCSEKIYQQMDVVAVSDKLLYDETNHWNNLRCNEVVAKVEKTAAPIVDDEIYALAVALVGEGADLEDVTPESVEEESKVQRVYLDKNGSGYVVYTVVINERYGRVETETLVHIGTDGVIKNLEKLVWVMSGEGYGVAAPSEESVNAFYDSLIGADFAKIEALLGLEDNSEGLLVTGATSTSANLVLSLADALAVVSGLENPEDEEPVLVTVQKNYAVNVAEHTFDENGVCTECKYNSNASVGLEYELNEDGTGYIVVGRGTCTDEHINIPAEYEGLPVVAIGDNAFEDILPEEDESEEEEGVTPTASVSVTKENGLRVLGVTIPDTVISISCTAFSNCRELNNFIVDVANTVYSATNNCLINNVLKTIVRGCEFSIIPDDGQVTVIGSYAFAGASGLVSITIPDSIEDVGDKAFMECDALVEVYMPENINIGVDVFRGSIHVEIKVEHALAYVAAKDATCYEAGNVEYYICTDCGYFYADQDAITRLYEVDIPASHDFVDGVCTECGKVQDEILIVNIDNISHLGMFPLGTLENAIGLPETVNVVTKDGVTHELAIVWDLSSYNKAEVGEYTITGVIQSGALHYAEGLTNKLEVGIEIVEKMVGTADIVFVLDISGSMGSYINNVKNNMIAIAQAIEAAGVSARWSVITYSDFTCSSAENEKTQVRKNGASDWSTTAADCKSVIESISLAGGGDLPETAVDGLMMANSLENRKDARVFYVVLTDDTYKNNNTFGISGMSEAITKIQEKGANVSVITTSYHQSSYSSLINTTGGIWCNISNSNFSQNLINALVPIIFGEVIA